MGDKKAVEFHKKKLRNYARTRDLNKDGFVTRRDYEQIVERFKELSAPPEHIMATVRYLETLCSALGLTDNSKSLTYDQFADVYVANLGVIAKETIAYMKSCFDAADANKNGVITIDEWEVIMKGLGFDTAHAKVTFDAMDIDKDGVITAGEFTEYHYEFFCSNQDTLNSSILMGPLQ